MLPQGEAAKRPVGRRFGGERAGRRRVERAEPHRRHRWRGARRCGRIPRGHLPARHPGHPGADDARRPDRFVDRRQDRRRPAGGQEPRRCLPPADRRSSSTWGSLRSLPERQRRAALGEAVKMAALGDERLFELLEAGRCRRSRAGARCGVRARRRGRGRGAQRLGQGRGRAGRRARARPRGGRITLNLGHSLGHAVEAAAASATCSTARRWPTGCARPAGSASAIGGDAAGARGPDRRGCSTRLRLGIEPLPYPLETVLGHLATDKKHAGGRLRWVLPTADGVAVRR